MEENKQSLEWWEQDIMRGEQWDDGVAWCPIGEWKGKQIKAVIEMR